MTTALNFQVSYQGNNLEITQCDSQSTIGQLKQHLQQETGVPPSLQKLLYKGKRLVDDSTTLNELGFNNKTKLMLMGSAAQQVAKIAQLDDKLEKNRETARRFHAQRIKPAAPSTTSSSSDTRYTFHRLTVIDEFPQPERARAILEKLRDDRGIRGIMQQRKWSVGELTELTPFEKTILGYNRNAGQLIALRLRTDDLSGFRSYNAIRKVLLHELTHNVWGEHDDNFHALNRQLNKDVVTLDWTAHGGHALNANGADFYEPEDINDSYTTSWQGGSYRLGGGLKTTLSSAEARELRARAAAARLTQQEEQELDQGCGSR
ncbi:WLM-domain-containing protein [Lichtheimia hyalospora FSU 10163]|nr:WLM-domain-containing protein [Lichtheimia hyalospora FSU 10163]